MKTAYAVSALAVVLVLSFGLVSPVLAQPPELELESPSAILMDAGTGEVLFEKNPDEKLYPASVTKIMTMLLAMEAIEKGKVSLDDMVRTSPEAASMGGSQIWLEVDEELTLEEMMITIAVVSANDASVAVAEHIAGAHDSFVHMMNERAEQLGMQNTNFVNSHGLHDPEHYTTARDVALMSRELVKHPKIFEWTTIWDTWIKTENRDSWLVNTNKLLRQGCDGLKTGYTPEAKACLSATQAKGDFRLIAVVLNAPSSKTRFGEAKKLLNWGFAHYDSRKVADRNEVFKTAWIQKGYKETVDAVARDDLYVLGKKGTMDNLQIRIAVPDDLLAPIKKGEKIGELLVEGDGGEIIGEVDLVSAESIPRGGPATMMKRILINWFRMKQVRR